MRTEAEIRQKGMEALIKELGEVDVEIFIKNLIREPFDYTKWQKKIWVDKSVQEISDEAENAVKERLNPAPCCVSFTSWESLRSERSPAASVFLVPKNFGELRGTFNLKKVEHI